MILIGYKGCSLYLCKSLMNVIPGINTFQFFVSSKLLSPQRRKLIKLLLLAVKKWNGNIFQVLQVVAWFPLEK